MSRRRLLFFIVTFMFVILIIEFTARKIKNWQPSSLIDRKMKLLATNTIYIYSSYYLPENELRLTAIVECNNDVLVLAVLTLTTGKAITIPLKKHLMHYCSRIMHYIHLDWSNCRWSGHYYSAQIPENVDKSIPITLKRDNSVLPVFLNVTIIQPNLSKKKYFLSACVKWITMNVDWQGILQYILMWQALGVEHFYMYVQEVSPEVDVILKIFESENLVERIARSSMPPTLNKHVGVNHQIDFSADTLTLNDCQLRTRDNSEWVTMADTDELIVAIDGRNQNVADFLLSLSQLHPNAGAFVFRSSKSRFPRLPSGNIALNSINFDYLKNVQTNRNAKAFRDMSRAIVRPDHLFRMGIHYVFQFEKWKPKAEEIAISPDIAVTLHLRRPITAAHPDSENLIVTNVLAPFADRATERWRQLVIAHNLSHVEWDYSATDVLQQMENCMRDIIRNGECLAFGHRCGRKLNQSFSWIEAPNSWTLV